MLKELKKQNTGKVRIKLIATLLVLTLSFANFALLGSYIGQSISYAIEGDSETNIENVKFNVYLDANNINQREISKDINANDMKVYLSVGVQGGGYLKEGKIEFTDCNFKTKSGKTVYEVDSIQTGKSIEKIIEVEANKDDNFDVSMLNKESSIKLTGTYVDNKGAEKKVEATKKVKIILTAESITKENNPIRLEQKVVTNKIYNISETEEVKERRVIQVEVRSGLDKNMYPIKGTKIEIEVPGLNGKYPEEVVVASYDTKATNGKKSVEFNNENIEYNQETHKLTINVENTVEGNKINWTKSGEDRFIVTYVYGKEVSTENFESNINSEINLYTQDNMKLTKEIKTKETNMGEKGEAITQNIEGTEVVYKSNMLIGENTEYNVDWTLEIGYRKIAEEISIGNGQEKLELNDGKEINAKSYYKTTTINKEEFLKLFGENGKIEIADEEEKVIQTITKETEADENGNIVVNYGNKNLETILIGTTKAQREGKLNIKHVKELDKATYTEAQIEKIEGIKTESVVYVEEKAQIEEEKEATIRVEMPQTGVEIGIENKNIIAGQKSQVNITATLKTSELKYRLYENPVIDIELPSEIENITLGEVNVLNGKGLQIKNKEVTGNEEANKVIRIELEGKQVTYGADTQIVIKGEIETEKYIATTAEEIKIKCANVEQTAEGKCKVNIISEPGLLLANSISNYNGEEPEITAFKTEEKTGLLNAASGAIIAKAKGTIINNTEEDIVNAVVTTNNNKKVEIGEIKKGEIKSFNYDIEIPANLGENKTIEQYYTVSYDGVSYMKSPVIILGTNIETSKQEEEQKFNNSDEKLAITMVSDPSAETILVPGQNVTYTINVTNLSNEPVESVIEGIIPEDLKIVQCELTGYTRNVETDGLEIEKREIEIDEGQNLKIDETIFEKKNITIQIDGVINESISKNQIKCEINAKIRLPNDTGLDENQHYASNMSVSIKHNVKPNIEIKDIEIPDKLTITKGETKKIEVKLKPENASVEDLKYTVDDKNIVTINEKGEITGITEGTTVVSIFTEDETIGKNCIIMVQEKIDEEDQKPDEEEPIIVKPEDKIDNNEPDLDPNAEDPSGEEPKQEEPKQEEPKQEEPKQEEPKQEEPKQEEPKQEEPSKEEPKYKILGIAWLDANKDGLKGSDEKLLKGILVRIKDAKTNKYLKNTAGEEIIAITNGKGEYTFQGLSKGKYIIEFGYNKSTYGLTTGEGKDNVANIVTVNEKTVITTDTIEITDTDKTGINIGLITNPKFDLQLDKYITKITVQNESGTTLYEYNQEQLAKVDIGAKKLPGSIVVIEYKIGVTNKGEVPGYAKKIVDYLSPELKFSSEMNKDWYENKDNNLYTTKLANSIINPGETKEVTLILTKMMTQDNTGLVNNTAKIEEDYNEYVSKEIKVDKVKADYKSKEEANDKSSADTIITVKTGGNMLYIGIVIGSMMILGGGIYLINKKVINPKVSE